MNLTCRAELGRLSLKLVTDLRMLNYRKHCENLPSDYLARTALQIDNALFINSNKPLKLFSGFLDGMQLTLGAEFMKSESLSKTHIDSLTTE